MDINFKSFPEQWGFINDKSPFPCAIAGTGGGKTYAGAIKAFFKIGNYPKDLPPTFGMVTAPTYKMLSDATIRTYQEVFPRELWEYNKTENLMTLHNGHQIAFRSTDDPDNLRGANLNWFHMDEGAMSDEYAFEVLQARLRAGVDQQGWITTTPRGFNWIYRRFVEGEDGEKPNPDYVMHHWSMLRNKFIPPEYSRRLVESYKGKDAFAMQEIDGKFVIISGDCFFDVNMLSYAKERTMQPIRTLGNTKIYKNAVVGHSYAAGVDVAGGTKKDRGTCIILDCNTGETVVEISDNTSKEDALAYHFNKIAAAPDIGIPYLPHTGVEVAGGWGQLFIKKLTELGYPKKLIYHSPHKECTGFCMDTDNRTKWGWSPNGGNKLMILNRLEEAVRDGIVVPYSDDMIEELGAFIRQDRDPNNPAKGYTVEAQAGSHDDRVMALAIAWYMRPLAKPAHTMPVEPTNFMETVNKF